MAFEVIVISASKTVANQVAVDTLVAQVQGIFGATVPIIVNEISKTYDAASTTAKEVGTITKRVAEFPAKVAPK